MEISTFISELEHLPKPVQQQLMDYFEFLLSKYPEKAKKTREKGFKFNWEGGLKTLKQKYYSVELQHHTNSLR